MPETKPRKLTARQKAFIRAYCTHWNGARAAREAGYSEKSDRDVAHKLLTKSHIAEIIRRKQAAIALEADTQPPWVIDQLKRQALRFDKRATHSGAIRALELIGKSLGMFREEERPNATLNIYHRLTLMTYEELDHEFRRLQAEERRLLAAPDAAGGEGVDDGHPSGEEPQAAAGAELPN